MTTLNFGQALEAIKAGQRISRAGWNGKGMFVYYVPAASYPAQTGVAKEHFGESAMVPYNAYMAIKNVDGTVSTWVPSVNDCLAEDWVLVDDANEGVHDWRFSSSYGGQLCAECGAVKGSQRGGLKCQYPRTAVQPVTLPVIDHGPDTQETALLKVLSAVQRYLPPDGISIETAMSDIIEAVDPWPIGRTTMEFMEHSKGVAQFTKRPETIALPVIDHGPDSLEREIQAKASVAPRVTPADIEAEIVSEHFFTASDAIQHENAVHEHKGGWFLGNTQLLTFCVIQLRNGFTVTGESACASPENFDAEIGRRIARENAVNKIWPLLGFRLRDQLAGPVLTEADAAADLAGTPRPTHA